MNTYLAIFFNDNHRKKNMVQSFYSPDSMANVELKWAKEVKHFCKNVPMILVANKIDIRTDQELLKELETDHIVSICV